MPIASTALNGIDELELSGPAQLHGHQLIERELTVAGGQMDGTITAERHFVDPTIPTAQVCGESGVRDF
jgi:hypothetical protein